MEAAVNIICLKVGKGLYDWSWVDKLYRGVTRSFTVPVNFYVMTDVVEPNVSYNQIQLPLIRTVQLSDKKDPLWWYKLYLFSPDNPLANQHVIYFDLDVVFIGNCDFLLDTPQDKFGVRKEFAHDIFFRNKVTDRPQGSIIVVKPSNFSYIWTNYVKGKKKVQATFETDQDYMAKIIPKQDYFYLDKKRIVSWKFNVMRGGMKRKLRPGDGPEIKAQSLNKIVYNAVDKFYVIPDDARIIVFHGKLNKPHHYLNADVIKENWI